MSVHTIKKRVEVELDSATTMVINTFSDYTKEEDIENLTTTASFTISKFAKYNGMFLFNAYQSKYLKVGQKIRIYIRVAEVDSDDTTPDFLGVISAIDTNDVTSVIKCENYMWYLKRDHYDKATVDTINKNVQEVSDYYTLEKIAELIIGNVKRVHNIEIAADTTQFKMTVPKFQVDAGVTSANILDLLKSKILINTFFKGNVLVFGANFDKKFIQDGVNGGNPAEKIKARKIHRFSCLPFDLVKNAPSKTHLFKAKKLIWRDYNERRFRIKTLIFNQTTNKAIDGPAYGPDDADSEIRTLVLHGKYDSDKDGKITDAARLAEIDTLIKSYAHKLNYAGFQKGSFVRAFGYPRVEVLDVVTLDGYERINEINRDGAILAPNSFYVCGVKTGFNDNDGFYRDLYLSNSFPLTQNIEPSVVDSYTKINSVFKKTDADNNYQDNNNNIEKATPSPNINYQKKNNITIKEATKKEDKTIGYAKIAGNIRDLINGLFEKEITNKALFKQPNYFWDINYIGGSSDDDDKFNYTKYNAESLGFYGINNETGIPKGNDFNNAGYIAIAIATLVNNVHPLVLAKDDAETDKTKSNYNFFYGGNLKPYQTLNNVQYVIDRHDRLTQYNKKACDKIKTVTETIKSNIKSFGTDTNDFLDWMVANNYSKSINLYNGASDMKTKLLEISNLK